MAKLYTGDTRSDIGSEAEKMRFANTIEVEVKELWLDVFEDELRGMHGAGFVHRSLKRPSNLGGLAFDNILLTEQGLRLIDVGISALKKQGGNIIFEKYVANEEAEMAEFRDYFLNR
ncbi:hypothetical protein [Rudanella lutea]|uniref:hypothetical protein n=1 Tax=Rudanella lutea TaxID=451374 RepID=UPI00039E647B|nr:hypothetical protein [Rudanella lutea]